MTAPEPQSAAGAPAASGAPGTGATGPGQNTTGVPRRNRRAIRAGAEQGRPFVDSAAVGRSGEGRGLRAAAGRAGARAGRATRIVGDRVGRPALRAAQPAWRATSRAVWPVLSPVLTVVSPFGWVVLASGLAALIAGTVFGWQELLVIAFACFAVLVLSVAFVVGRSAYTVKLNLATNRVVVGTRAVGSIVIGNSSTRSLLPSRIELPVGAGLASFHVPRLAPGAEHDDLFGIPTARRAVLNVGPVKSVRGDPLGLLRREIRWTDAIELFVHPRTVRLEGSSSGFIRDLEGQTTKDLSNDDVSFHALREYVAGDDRRNIHWKTSARTGTLMVRQFEETRRSHLALALSTSLADYGDPDEFELAVSSCGSLGIQALLEERDVTVMVQSQTLHTETGRRLLDDLSAVEQRTHRESIVHLAKTAGEAVPNASVAVLLFGASVTPTQMRQASVQLPFGVRVIAVRCQPGAPVGRRMIGELTLLTIGDLTELAPALRRVNA
ncbi:hypothetical protein B7R54_00300 [Subtercola boreus]|uniref:DUF58 domain-containing protein n=1 Tax=Subtercola boreus TaxID=120213 RepID=A0A3E0VE42_9MICO|nr:DUF58 domain-containing protein [Subtercola boreus]RFA07823.1 hypothetical protein B7R54_00300 [Subtercola boreus]TQL55329.1 uncharacterized protein (DUF58 family) [Subtercola boreus]